MSRRTKMATVVPAPGMPVLLSLSSDRPRFSARKVKKSGDIDVLRLVAKKLGYSGYQVDKYARDLYSQVYLYGGNR